MSFYIGLLLFLIYPYQVEAQGLSRDVLPSACLRLNPGRITELLLNMGQRYLRMPDSVLSQNDMTRYWEQRAYLSTLTGTMLGYSVARGAIEFSEIGSSSYDILKFGIIGMITNYRDTLITTRDRNMALSAEANSEFVRNHLRSHSQIIDTLIREIPVGCI